MNNSVKRIICLVLSVVCVLSSTAAFALLGGDSNCPRCGSSCYTSNISISVNNSDGTHTTSTYKNYRCDHCNRLRIYPRELLSETTSAHTYESTWHYGNGIDYKKCTAAGCNAQLWRNHVHNWVLTTIVNNYGLGYTYYYKCACGQTK